MYIHERSPFWKTKEETNGWAWTHNLRLLLLIFFFLFEEVGENDDWNLPKIENLCSRPVGWEVREARFHCDFFNLSNACAQVIFSYQPQYRNSWNYFGLNEGKKVKSEGINYSLGIRITSERLSVDEERREKVTAQVYWWHVSGQLGWDIFAWVETGTLDPRYVARRYEILKSTYNLEQIGILMLAWSLNNF